MNDKQLFKIICMSSFVTGVILGILSLIPILTGMALISVMFVSSPFVIIYLYKLNLIKELDIPKCLIIGGVTGFFAFIGFSLIYFPVSFIMYLILKLNSFIWIKVMFENMGFLIPAVCLTALLCGLMNMFSAFMLLSLFDYFKFKKEE